MKRTPRRAQVEDEEGVGKRGPIELAVHANQARLQFCAAEPVEQTLCARCTDAEDRPDVVVSATQGRRSVERAVHVDQARVGVIAVRLAACAEAIHPRSPPVVLTLKTVPSLKVPPDSVVP